MSCHGEVEPKQEEESVHAWGWVLHGVLETKQSEEGTLLHGKQFYELSDIQ